MSTNFHEPLISNTELATESIESLRRELEILRLRFRALSQAVGGQIWITDAQGENVLWCNQIDDGENANVGSVQDRVGYLHVEDQTRVMAAIEQSLRLHQTLELEVRSGGKDNSAEYLMIRGVPIVDHHKNLREWLGIVWDVDRWRLAERDRARELSLRTQSEQLLRRNNELLHVLAILAQQLIGLIEANKLLPQMWATVRGVIPADAYLWIGFQTLPDCEDLEIIDRSGTRLTTLESHLRCNPVFAEWLAEVKALVSQRDGYLSDRSPFFAQLNQLLSVQGYQSTFWQSILPGDSPVGLLVFMARDRGCFSETERAFFATIGNYLSLAHQRMQARRVALDQNTRLSLALRTSRMAVCELDLGNFQLLLSPEFSQLLGISQEHLTWEQWQQLVDPRDRLQLQDKFSTALAQQCSFDTEFRIQRADGRQVWVSKICEPIFENDRGLVRFLGTIQDVTSRKEIEHDLFVKAEHLREAQRIAGLSSFRWDAKQDRFLWSESVDQIHGCGWGRATNDLADFLKNVHPDDQKNVENLLASALASKRNFAFEYRSWNVEKREFQWFAARGHIILDDQGELAAVKGTCQDVTERRLNEEVMRERDERRRLAVDSVGSVVWSWDPETQMVEVVVCAKEWSQLLTKTRFKLAEALELVHPDDRESLLTSVNFSDDTTQPIKFHVRILIADHVRWVSCSANFVRVATGNTLKLFGISQDITEQVLMQEKLAAQNQQLLHAARLSTLGTLTAVMSHELSQPFTAIANFASAAKAVVDSPRVQDRQLLHQYLEKIGLQSVRAGSIIRNLRSFSRKSDSAIHHTDLEQIISDSIGMLQLELRQRRVRLTWDRKRRDPWLAIDPVQLQQLLINLLTNAIDAVERNPVGQRLIMLTTHQDEANSGVWIEVADNGPGVPPHIQPNLFQPFTCGKSNGTGIGLSICRDIVINHQGKIEYRPRETGGAVFAVWFPVAGQS